MRTAACLHSAVKSHAGDLRSWVKLQAKQGVFVACRGKAPVRLLANIERLLMLFIADHNGGNVPAHQWHLDIRFFTNKPSKASFM